MSEGENQMDLKLFVQAIVKYVLGLVVVGLLTFVPAGTLWYPGGLLLMGCLFGPMFIAGLVLMAWRPNLLRERLDVRESEQEQRFVIAASGLLFVAVFVTAGLSFRFGWLTVSGSVQHAAAVVFLFAYALYGEVLRENTYLSRTVKVQEGQQVISTGLYGVVRHPMYMASTLLFLAMPLMLGSLAAFVLMLLYLPLIVMRIMNEESVLAEGLPGYKEYQGKVKYRLVPFIW